MRALSLVLSLLISVPAFAAPRVVTDIAPVHSLVAMVMKGVGEPHLLIPADASPHHYSLRPSDAAALNEADAVFWIGPGLTPWLERLIRVLAQDAREVVLMEAPNVVGLEWNRPDASLTEGGRPHTGLWSIFAGAPVADPHIWLDPKNAAAMLDTMAEALAALDEENAPVYRANARAARDALDALTEEIADALPEPKPYIVFHDAYGHFERRFGLSAVGAVTLSDGETPGPRRIGEIVRSLKTLGIVCAFTEPQFPESTVRAVTRGSDVRVAVLDPLGASLAPGPDLYPEMMRGLAAAMRDCLGD